MNELIDVVQQTAQSGISPEEAKDICHRTYYVFFEVIDHF